MINHLTNLKSYFIMLCHIVFTCFIIFCSLIYANSKTRLLIVVGVLCKLVCNYKFANYTALGKWRLEKKSHDPAPEPVAYALTQSSSHASHQLRLQASAVDMVTGGPQCCDHLGPAF